MSEHKSELAKLCEKLKITAEVKAGNNVKLTTKKDEWRRDKNAWTVTLKYGGRKLSVPFFTGDLHGEPTAADVISSLCIDANCGEMSFEDFCSELGYDEDSRSAEATWKACVKTAPRVRKLLGDRYEEVASASH